jgi:hypothetical protein
MCRGHQPTRVDRRARGAAAIAVAVAARAASEGGGGAEAGPSRAAAFGR